MCIKGLDKVSLIDYPGKIGPVLFLGGCNLRCRYCQNPDLALDSKELPEISEIEILEFLKKRASLIDGVTISGGEPTLSKNLIPLLKKIKEFELNIKLDSNGFFPELIGKCIDAELVDYVAIDVKTSPGKYNELTGRDVDFSKIVDTFNILKNSSIVYEARTVCIPDYVTAKDLHESN